MRSNTNWLFVTKRNQSAFREWKKQKKHPKKEQFDQTQTQTTNQPTPVLPPDFAKDIFKYEMELESSQCNYNTIVSLLQLYRIGLEYYECQMSQKYLVFKNKSQELLTRNRVQQILKNDGEPIIETPKLKKIEKSKQVVRTQSTEKIIEQKMEVIKTKKEGMTQWIENDMKDLLNMKDELNKMMEGQFRQQEQSIQNRLQQRKSKVLTKGLSADQVY